MKVLPWLLVVLSLMLVGCGTVAPVEGPGAAELQSTPPEEPADAAEDLGVEKLQVYTIRELYEEIRVHLSDTNPLRVDAHRDTEYSWRGSIDSIERPGYLVMWEGDGIDRMLTRCSFNKGDREPLLTLNLGDEVVLRGNFEGTNPGRGYAFRNCILVSGPEPDALPSR